MAGKQKNLSALYKITSVGFWILLWQMISMSLNKKMFLASPVDVIIAFYYLFGTKTFWISILFSFCKISFGFLLAVLCGIVSALLANMHKLLNEIISVPIKLMKSIPVASFVILALIWVDSQNLSVLISFVMVLPLIFTNIQKGVEETDQKLLEMAEVFRFHIGKKIRYIYIPAVMPYFVSACSVGLGFCWKSGIAAEVIGLPKNSIGSKLYEAKLYLLTSDLFAWTITIVVISIILEKFVMAIIRFLQRKLVWRNKPLK